MASNALEALFDSCLRHLPGWVLLKWADIPLATKPAQPPDRLITNGRVVILIELKEAINQNTIFECGRLSEYQRYWLTAWETFASPSVCRSAVLIGFSPTQLFLLPWSRYLSFEAHLGKSSATLADFLAAGLPPHSTISEGLNVFTSPSPDL